MTFECKDLDIALEAPELSAEATAHINACPECANSVRLWREVAEVAPQVREEWESPGLWLRIATAMKAEPVARDRRWGSSWKFYGAIAAAAAVLVVAVLSWPFELSLSPPIIPEGQFLTAETFRDLERTKAAYVRAIEKLSAAAAPGLERSSTPLAAVYREKLMLLDSAISDLRSGVNENPYNVYLQNQLALLYEEKEKTLKEWIENEKGN